MAGSKIWAQSVRNSSIFISFIQICVTTKIIFPTGYSGTSFLATFDTSPVTPTDPIVFNYPVHNSGGHYDPTTGIYTVPLDGLYEFIFRLQAYSDASVGAYLVVDGDYVSLLSISSKHK